MLDLQTFWDLCLAVGTQNGRDIKKNENCFIFISTIFDI